MEPRHDPWIFDASLGNRLEKSEGKLIEIQTKHKAHFDEVPALVSMSDDIQDWATKHTKGNIVPWHSGKCCFVDQLQIPMFH
jgi:hypothetical protein